LHYGEEKRYHARQHGDRAGERRLGWLDKIAQSMSRKYSAEYEQAWGRIDVKTLRG
jgi:hypothetical protein